MRKKWTKEKCHEEALKYETRSEFQKKNHSSYNSALNNKWLDEICSHMISQQKPNGYWDIKKCKEVASKYETRIDFFNEDPGVYSKCQKEKWLDDVCSHMKPKKLRNYWTEKKCKEEALKYETRVEFSRKSSRAYQLCLKNDWIKEYDHLKVVSYTKNYCKEESEKYKTLKELIKNNFYLYNKILKNNWSDEMFSHMIQTGNLYKRCIYSYEFPDNRVYVGLTLNLKKRNISHMKKGPVKKHINETQNIPRLIKLTDYIDVEEAKNKEKEYLEKYINDNWIVLNKMKTGGIGSCSKKWTKEKCINEALKYKTKNEYFQGSPSYHFARKNGWLNEICSHMIELRKPNNYWNYDKCLKEAIKQRTKSNFRKCIRAYNVSIENNWLNDIYSYMKWKIPNKPKKYWEIYENCLNEAIKYKTPTDFIKKSSYAYKHSLKNGWIEKIYIYMKWNYKQKISIDI